MSHSKVLSRPNTRQNPPWGGAALWDHDVRRGIVGRGQIGAVERREGSRTSGRRGRREGKGR
eukprot:2471023-Rhodomonas_salina.1